MNRRQTKSRWGRCFEKLEDRRVLAASLGWDGPGLGSAELTYHIANAPPTLSQAQVNAAIESAFDAWADVANISFQQTDTPGLRNSIDISFEPLDGRGDILAQAYFPDDVNSPVVAGDIQFDLSENWEIGNSLGRSAFDLVSVAVHEIGHSLGLGHSHDEGVLAPTISPNEYFVGLSQSDVLAIQSLYAPAPTSLDPADDPVDAASDDASERPEIEQRVRRFAERFRRWTTDRIELPITNDGVVILFQPGNRLHNHLEPRDVNGDEFVSPLDVLLIINTINSGDLDSDHQCDTNNDGSISPIDALMVVNRLNEPTQSDDAPELTASGESDRTSSGNNENDNTENDIVDEPDDAATGADTGDDRGSAEDPGEGYDSDRQRGTFIGRLQRIASELFPVIDTSGDGLLTEDEVPEIVWERLLVYDLDTNGDNAISLDEAHERIAALRLDIFRGQDVNDDGQLTEDEVGANRWNRLKRADVDESGGVSFDELEDFRSQSRFDRFDADMSGGLTETELGEQRWNRLSRFDADDDGELTEDELPRRWEVAGRPAPWLRFARMALRFAAVRRFFT